MELWTISVFDGNSTRYYPVKGTYNWACTYAGKWGKIPAYIVGIIEQTFDQGK